MVTYLKGNSLRDSKFCVTLSSDSEQIRCSSHLKTA